MFAVAYRCIVWSVIAPSLFLVATIFATAPALAQSFPWCAIMDNDGNTQCNYSTLQQCLQTLSGIGGRCVQNPAGNAPPSAPPYSENAQGLLPLQLQNPGPPPGLDGAGMPPPPNN
jgi:hypothetical protein